MAIEDMAMSASAAGDLDRIVLARRIEQVVRRPVPEIHSTTVSQCAGTRLSVS